MGAILAFFGSAAGRWLVILLVAGAMSAAAYFHGRQYERGIVDGERLKDADAFIGKLVSRATRDREEQGRVESALDKERAARSQDQRNFEEKLRNVPRETIFEVVQVQPTNEHAAGSTEPPSGAREGDGAQFVARLSAGGCRLWNEALAAGTTVAERAGWIAGADACAGSVEVDDALRNVRENAALLGQCRSREQMTFAWMEREGLIRFTAK